MENKIDLRAIKGSNSVRNAFLTAATSPAQKVFF